MGEYDSSVALAKRLIAQKGQSAVLRSYAAGTSPDPTKPWEPGENTAVDQIVSMVFLNYKQRYVDGTLIQSGDQKVLMLGTDVSGAVVTPKESGVVVRGDELWKIIDVVQLNPNGESILYKLQVRQ